MDLDEMFGGFQQEDEGQSSAEDAKQKSALAQISQDAPLHGTKKSKKKRVAEYASVEQLEKEIDESQMHGNKHTARKAKRAKTKEKS